VANHAPQGRIQIAGGPLGDQDVVPILAIMVAVLLEEKADRTPQKMGLARTTTMYRIIAVGVANHMGRAIALYRSSTG
jgi:hypothetical protein